MSLSASRLAGRRISITRLPTCSAIQFRNISSTHSAPVQLEFEKADAESSTSGTPPIVVLHGLFGQKQNWRSLARAMAKSMNTDVYALDLRNHGTSPHHPDMTFLTMANDVRHFFDVHGLSNVALIGHSMGGKVASALALNPDLPEGTLSSLIIADVTPFKFSISPEFKHYLKAMRAVEHAKVHDAKSAQKILAAHDIELPIQQFLMTNLGGNVNGSRKFRIPLDILTKSVDDVGDFPYEVGSAKYEGPTMVIRGSRSDYVPLTRIDKMRQFFPNLQVESLDTGHWLHAEKPTEFLAIVKRFIASSQP